MFLVFLVVCLERLDKNLVLKLLSNPRERVSIRTIQQSRVPRKRRSKDREACMKRKRGCMRKNPNIYKRKKVKVNRKPVRKQERKKEDEMANSCFVNTCTLRSKKCAHKDKYIANSTLKCINKDLPVELPVKRKRGRPRKTSSLDGCIVKQLANSSSVGRGRKNNFYDIHSATRACKRTSKRVGLSADSGHITKRVKKKSR
jgi:hypothetical protein